MKARISLWRAVGAASGFMAAFTGNRVTVDLYSIGEKLQGPALLQPGHTRNDEACSTASPC
jgi:hypothetical protein